MAGIPQPVRRENALQTFRLAWLWLTLLVVVMGLAFWKSYLGILDSLPSRFGWTLHLHGALMAGWIILLPAQAWFVRSGRLRLHRIVGRASYVYIPLTILSGIVTMRGALAHTGEAVTFEQARDATFQHVMLLSLAITWGLAIAFRRTPALHIRYMISTILAIGSAIFFRLFFFWVPALATYDTAVHANFTALFLIAAVLIANDWRVGVRRSPFWIATALLVVQYVAYRVVAPMDLWRAYCTIIAG